VRMRGYSAGSAIHLTGSSYQQNRSTSSWASEPADPPSGSGRAMLEALIGGERDPQTLADLAKRKLRNGWMIDRHPQPRLPGAAAGAREDCGQEAVPVTVVPDLVTWYVTVAPDQKWKVSVTGAPSLSDLRKSALTVVVLAL
jgi:hypothetical protein